MKMMHMMMEKMDIDEEDVQYLMMMKIKEKFMEYQHCNHAVGMRIMHHMSEMDGEVMDGDKEEDKNSGKGDKNNGKGDKNDKNNKDEEKNRKRRQAEEEEEKEEKDDKKNNGKGDKNNGKGDKNNGKGDKDDKDEMD